MQQEGPFSVWGLDKKHERACGTPSLMPAPELPKPALHLHLTLHLPFFSPPIPPLQSSKRTDESGSTSTNPGKSFWPREQEEGPSFTH